MPSIKLIPHNALAYPLEIYPIAFFDYLWVISLYITISFFLAVLIDGYLLPPFDKKKESKESSIFLGCKVLLQLAAQGFIAVLISALLQKIPSPFHGLFGYDRYTPLGILIRNPAIISVILFALSSSLRERLLYLFSRFDKNASESL